MTEEQIAKLKEMLENGEPIYWMGDSPKKIVSIGPDVFKEHGEPEPSDVAYIDGGGYVALWICDVSDFVILKRIEL